MTGPPVDAAEPERALAEILTDAYRCVAPKTLAARLDDATPD